MTWQIVAAHDVRGNEVLGKWEIADIKGNLITEFTFLDVDVADTIVQAHNRCLTEASG